MPPSLDLPTFIARWQRSTLTERSAAQQHVLDLCAVLGDPTPVTASQDGSYVVMPFDCDRGCHNRRVFVGRNVRCRWA